MMRKSVESYAEIESTSRIEQEQGDRMEGNRRKTLVIGGAIAALIVAAVLILVLVLTLRVGSDFKCKLEDLEPRKDLSNLANIRSSNDLALAKFAGYLKLTIVSFGDVYETKYLSLDLKSISYSMYANQSRYLTLETDCARLEFVVKVSPSHLYQVSDINVAPKTECARFDRCTISEESFNTIAEQHYKCLYDRTYECVLGPNGGNSSHENGIRAVSEVYLVTNEIEFEVDGDPEKISQGQFSKPQRECR